MIHMSIEDPDNGSPLLPQAVEDVIPMPVSNRQYVVTKTDSRHFLSRTENLALSLLLLIGCYSAILIPAYFPLDTGSSLSDDYQQPKDLVLLNRSASLLSGPCQPHWCPNRLRSLDCCASLLDIPVFVQAERPWDLSPPQGFRGVEKHLALALASLPQPGLPSWLKGEGICRRCVVVGSGGVLYGSHLGSHIDQYDIIIRLNNAPVPGFERDVGSRTTIRLVYPETAPHSAIEYKKYKETPMVAVVAFKGLDLDWLTSVITKHPLSFWSKLWFWKKVVESIPLRPENFRILNPEIVHKTGQVLKKYGLNQRHLMMPTVGASAVVMALQLCDQVSLAGFGYDMQQPHTRLHYYEKIRMSAMKSQVVHDISAEKVFLRDLVVSGVVTDLTGAI